LRSSGWLGGLALLVLAVNLVFDKNHMFLVEWPHELDVINQALVVPLNTHLLALGLFALFTIFFLTFVFSRFDQHPVVPVAGRAGVDRDLGATRGGRGRTGAGVSSHAPGRPRRQGQWVAPRPASRARTSASARPATCSFAKIAEL